MTGQAWTRAMAVSLVLATWLLVVVGGFVRVTGSGMGCPGWPDCAGRWLPVSDAKALIEMTHRYVAAAVSLLVGLSVVATWRTRHESVDAFRAALLAAGLIAVQIGLGAWTVATGNRADTVVAHLVTAFLLLAAATWMAVRSMAPPEADPGRARLAKLGPALATSVLVLAALGAAVQVTAGGFACPEFPLCGGAVWPTSRGFAAQVHMLHRGMVIIAAVLLALVASSAKRAADAPLRRLAALAVAAFGVQAVVGIAQVVLHMPPSLRLTHLALGAATWVVMIALVARASAPAARSTRLEPAGARLTAGALAMEG